MKDKNSRKQKRPVKNCELILHPRIMDRHSADARKEGKAIKKAGAGRNNWGSYKDEIAQVDEIDYLYMEINDIVQQQKQQLVDLANANQQKLLKKKNRKTKAIRLNDKSSFPSLI